MPRSEHQDSTASKSIWARPSVRRPTLTALLSPRANSLHLPPLIPPGGPAPFRPHDGIWSVPNVSGSLIPVGSWPVKARSVSVLLDGFVASIPTGMSVLRHRSVVVSPAPGGPEQAGLTRRKSRLYIAWNV